MSLKFSSIKSVISGVPLSMTAYSFQSEGESITVHTDSTNTERDNFDVIRHCFVVEIDSVFIIRSDAINTKRKALQLKALLNKLSEGKAKRHCSLQLCSPITEWESIASQHQALFELKESIPHINFSLENPFVPLTTPFLLPAERKASERLSLFQNAWGWLIFGDWFEEAIENIRNYIRTEDLKVYSLEANLDDFMKEANSSFIKNARKEIASLMDRIAIIELSATSTDGDLTELIALEKELLLRRRELVEIVHAEARALEAIVRNCSKIESDHPFVIALRQQGSLLATLMSTQVELDESYGMPRGQQIILLQLLNELMKVDTFTCCGAGFERTSLAFSIQLATLIMRKIHKLDVVISLAQNWLEIRNSTLGAEFRKLVWELFLAFSLPIQQQLLTKPLKINDQNEMSEQWKLFLPDKIDKHHLQHYLSNSRSPHG